MNEFRETFRETVSVLSQGMVIPGELRFQEDRDVFVMPKQGVDGFEAQLECMDYGVYPSAEDWHGGCWDVTVWKSQDLGASLEEFCLSILNDAVLEVCCSGGKPYKWVLHHTFQGQRFKDETGLLFYNWFGPRTTKEFTNAQYAT
jgi:hypothetical protein